MDVDEGQTMLLDDLIAVLREAGIPYDPKDEAGARAAYTKAFAAMGKRQRVAKA